MIPLATILPISYSVLTILKLTQWGMFRWQQSSSSSQRRQEQQHGKNKITFSMRDMYKPTTGVIVNILNLVLYGGQLQVNKVPRKAFRQVSDRWIEAYNKKSNNEERKKHPKSFDSLDEANADFFCDLCQESFGFAVWFLKKSALAYINHPLGVCNVISALLFMIFVPFLFLREVLFMGGGPNSTLCKLGAAATITDIYVVCCKENLSFEQAMHKYPWTSCLFKHPQIHPMIGSAVCPVYKRDIAVPTHDKMNFDIHILSNPGGTAVVEQVFASSKLPTLWYNDILPSHLILFAIVVYEVCIVGTTNFWNMILSVAPYAAMFFTTRTLVDRSIGIEWLDKYLYSP